MSQYLLLIHGNAISPIPESEWQTFFALARASGFFEGGSALGDRKRIGSEESAPSIHHLAGYMRFDTENREALIELLQQHPVVRHGGTIDLCHMPRS